jgi:hypothetical protein
MSHKFLPTPQHYRDAMHGVSGLAAYSESHRAEILAKIAAASAAIPSWPSYTGLATLVGTSPLGKVTVYVDASLGPLVITNANDLIANGDAICTSNDAIFGTTGAPVRVVIFALGGRTNGEGGADHLSCDYATGGNIEVDFDNGGPLTGGFVVTSGQGPRPSPLLRTHALFEAELSECSMGGNLCGVSTGEALSRWCAIHVAGNVLTDFKTANLWLLFQQDWINNVAPTDRSNKATGCGMAFLSWLQSKNMGGLGIPLSTIAPKLVALGAGGTFAQLYAQLTGKPAAAAFPDFQAAIKAVGQVKLASSPAGDDPFNALDAPIV